MEITKFAQQVKVARDGLLTLRRLHEKVNHLPAGAFVAGGQIITNAHDGHVLVDEIGQVKVRFQRSSAVHRQARDEDRDQNNANLLLFLHPYNLFREGGESQRGSCFAGDLLGEDHVEGTDEHGRGDERRDHTKGESVPQHGQRWERRDDVGHEGSNGGDHGQRERHREVPASSEPRFCYGWVLVPKGTLSSLEVDGVVDAEAEHQRRNRGLQRREASAGDVQNPVGPDEGTRQPHEGKGHAGKGTERNGEHDDDDGKGEQHQEQQIVKGALVNVVGE